MSSLADVFFEIKKIFEKHAEGLQERDEYIGSQAKVKKPAYHLYGSKDVSLFGKKPQPTYVGGVIQQKNYVSFYLSAVYSHPELVDAVNPELKKYLKGKSCFNIPKASPGILQQVEDILAKGIAKYREIEWI